MTVVGRPGRHDSGPGLVCALGFAALGQVSCLGPYLVVAAAHPSSALLAGPLTRTMLLPGAGVLYFDEREWQAVERRLVRRLQALGYDVSLLPTVPAA